MKRILAVIALAALLGTCAPNLTKPETFIERAAYAEASAQGYIKTLSALTCQKYTAAGVCASPGRPLHPARSVGYLDTLSKARAAAKIAIGMPLTGGECLGQPSTPEACLALASSMLLEVERILTEAQTKGK